MVLIPLNELQALLKKVRLEVGFVKMYRTFNIFISLLFKYAPEEYLMKC